MKGLLTVLFAVFCMSFANAQSTILKGKVIDLGNNNPVGAAVITLLRQKDSIRVREMVTDQNGVFEFDNLNPEGYIIKISTLSYQEYVSLVTLSDGVKDLGVIKLIIQGKNLSGVTVVAKAAAVTQKGDTVQYSASQYKVNKDATTEDLIKKIPGVTVDRSGNVTAQGEAVKKVTIDGKDFFGDDASAALKNVQSEMVDKIQIYDRMSDQARMTGFDDGNSVKAINIVTKSGMKNGNLGRVFAGYGTDNRYNVGGNSTFLKNNRKLTFVGSFNNINVQNFGGQDLLSLTGQNNNRGGGPPGGGRPGGFGQGNDFSVQQANGISTTNAIGVNFANKYGKKLDLTGSYFYNNSNNVNTGNTNTETFLTTDTSLFTKQYSNTITKNNNHRINMRLEYMIDSANSIYIIPSINFQTNNATSFSTLLSEYSNRGVSKFYDTANTSLNNNTNNRDGYNIKNSILYRHSFAKKGRSISIGLNNSFANNNSESFVNANYKYFINNLLVKDSLQNRNTNNDANTIGTAATIAYTEPLSKKAQLQFDYNPSVQKSTADQQTFGFDGTKYSKFDTLLSNKFENKIVTNNAGVTYRFIPGKEELIQAGLSFQTTKLTSNRDFPSISKVNATFSNILGNVIFRKKFNTRSSMRLFYRGGTNFPSITQLQDVVNLSNPLRVSIGNAALTQSYTNFLGSRYIYTNTKTSRSFFAGIFMQTAKDYISNATFIPTADSTIQNNIVLRKGTQLTKPINLNGYRMARSFVTYSFPIKTIKSVLNLNAMLSYQKLPGLINTTKFITTSATYTTGFTLASNISEFIDFNLSYAANFNNATANNIITKYLTQSVGFQMNLINKKGWFLQNDVNFQANSGLSAGFNQSYGLWNAGVGKKFLKNQTGELKLSVFDLLKQNQSIVRTVDSRYIEDAQSNVLRQYFMLTFTYSLKNFGKAAKPVEKADNKEEINRLIPRGPGGGF